MENVLPYACANLKNKAYIITYIILIILALISIHVINMISSPDNTDMDELIEINKVYVNNQTQLTGRISMR